MNYETLKQKVGDSALNVIVYGDISNVSSRVNIDYFSIKTCVCKAIYFVTENKLEVLTETIPLMVVTRAGIAGNSLLIKGNLFKGMTDFIIGGSVLQDSGVTNFDAVVERIKDSDIQRLNTKYNIKDIATDTIKYGKLIEDALKVDCKQSNVQLDDILWDGIETLSTAIDVAIASQENFRKYLNNYLKSVVRHNRSKDAYGVVLNNFSRKIAELKIDSNRIANLIEKISPITAKTLNPIVPRIRLSKLLVKTYGYSVFSVICSFNSLGDLVRKFTLDCERNIDFDDELINTINKVSETFKFGEENTYLNKDYESWRHVLCKGLHALANPDFICVAILSFFLEDFDSGDLSKLYSLKREGIIEDSVDLLTILEQNPYVLHYFNDEIRTGVLDTVALSNGLIGRIKGVKETIVLNLRKSIACLDYFKDNSQNVGSTIEVIDSTFNTKDSKLSKSIFDIMVTRKRAYHLLVESGFVDFAKWDMPIAGTYGFKFKELISGGIATDGIKKVERECLHQVFGNMYAPTQIQWNYRGMYQYGGRRSVKISLIQSTEQERVGVLNIAEKTGQVLGLKYNGKSYFGTTRDIANEYGIFTCLNELKNRDISFDKDRIESLIAEFEDIKGFKLEEKQRDAARAVGNNLLCITGPAGSGKTTAAEVLLYVIENVYGGTVVFAAPTGRAADRLRETVNRPVYTLHRLFKISDNEDAEINAIEADTLVIDEMSMVNSALLNRALKGINLKKTRLILIADIEQLPPIGAGKPFADIIRKKYFPVVELDVVKRCVEGSAVTLNSSIMIGKQPESIKRTTVFTDEEHQKFVVLDMKPSQNNNDKYLKEQHIVIDLVNHHLGRPTRFVREENGNHYIGDVQINSEQFKDDDIVVVTPLKKAGHRLGSTQLNTLLQPIFNPEDSVKMQVLKEIGNNMITLRVGDRVLHTKNNYTKARFVLTEDGKITEFGEHAGVMNGEIGKIAFIRPLEDLRDLYQQNYNLNSDIQEQIEDVFDRPEEIAIGVSYTALDTNGDKYNFYILYLVDIKGKMDTRNIYNQIVIGDCNELDHAYALTVHKMQGSQSKLVICPIFELFYGLKNRNMAYTAVTRTQDVSYLVGDIVSSITHTSAFTDMLKIQAIDMRKTVLEDLMVE